MSQTQYIFISGQERNIHNLHLKCTMFNNENELNKLNKWQQIHHFLQVFSSSC
jgi:hypothetical protein